MFNNRQENQSTTIADGALRCRHIPGDGPRELGFSTLHAPEGSVGDNCIVSNPINDSSVTGFSHSDEKLAHQIYDSIQKSNNVEMLNPYWKNINFC